MMMLMVIMMMMMNLGLVGGVWNVQCNGRCSGWVYPANMDSHIISLSPVPSHHELVRDCSLPFQL